MGKAYEDTRLGHGYSVSKAGEIERDHRADRGETLVFLLEPGTFNTWRLVTIAKNPTARFKASPFIQPNFRTLLWLGHPEYHDEKADEEDYYRIVPFKIPR